MELSKPRNQIAEVLFELITKETITRKSILQSCGILNVTSRIADLRIRHNVDVKCQEIETTNKHGRNITYGKWYLSEKEKENILEKYNRVNHEF